MRETTLGFSRRDHPGLRDLAVEAKNTCTRIVKLAEAGIGRELKAARERGGIARRHSGRKAAVKGSQELVGDPHQLIPTLRDLGISRDQSVDYQILASARIGQELKAARRKREIADKGGDRKGP